jgi:alpha-glucoside transport system substrate-binding protein
MVPPPLRLASVIAAAALILVACSNNNNGGASGGGGGGGNTVSMLVVFGGDELKHFETALKPFEDANNIDVKIESNRDANAILHTRIDGGNPPDVAGLPGPGPMAQWARDGDLKEMPQDVKDTLASDYSDTYTSAGSVDGKLVGIFAKVSLKGLIWYNPKAFQAAGYQVPTDDASFQALVDKIANDGPPPWGIGLESGAATGWPATDWIEDFMVRQSGPDKYDEWWQGKLKFSSPEVKAAFEAFGKWATDEKYTFGGPNKELTLAFGNSGDCMFADKPQCYLVHQGSFMSGFFETNFPDKAKAGETYDYFMMPGQQFNAITNSGDVFGMFNDTDAAKKLMAYLVSKDFQEAWVKTGGVLSANKNVSPDTYPDETGKRAAQDLANAEIIRYDASDLMPSSLNDAFFKAVGQYLQNPDQLDTILKGLDDAQAQAYQQ